MKRERAQINTTSSLVLIASLGMALSILAFLLVRDRENKLIESRFASEARNSVQALERVLNLNLEKLNSLVSFYNSSEKVTPTEFHQFAAPTLARYRSIQALEWAPRIPSGQRATFEQEARQSGYPAFQITETTSEGNRVAVPSREEYYPVYLIEPFDPNAVAQGFDLASDPVRAQALRLARDTGRVQATRTFDLLQGEPGFLVFDPVYQDGATDTATRRRDKLQGFCVGVFRVNALVEHTLQSLPLHRVNLTIYEMQNGHEGHLLYFHAGHNAPSTMEPAPCNGKGMNGFSQRIILKAIPGQRWEIICTPTPEFLGEASQWQSWGILLVGLLSTGFIVSLFYVNRRHTEGLEVHVASRTKALSQALVDIQKEMVERCQAEIQLKQNQEELQEALSDLENTHHQLKATQLQLIQAEKLESVGKLAAGVAHEVKNPLQTMLMGLTYLEQADSSEVGSPTSTASNQVVQEVYGDMREAIERADAIIRGLLQMSGNPNLDMAGQDINELLDRALNLVTFNLNSSRVEAVREFTDHLPHLWLDHGKMEQVFLNLFTNAIHAMPEGGTLTVRTALRQTVTDRNDPTGSGEEVVVEILDTGLGIQEEDIPRLFTPFFTTKEKGMGTGLGLSVTQSIIELHGGTITLDNLPQGGCQATITIPVRKDPNHEKTQNPVC